MCVAKWPFSGPTNYGDFENPNDVGEPVKLIQGKYAFVLVGIADEPITPEDFFRLSAVIQQELPEIKGVGTVRQDSIPVISEEVTVAYAGNLRLTAYYTEGTTNEPEVPEP